MVMMFAYNEREIDLPVERQQRAALRLSSTRGSDREMRVMKGRLRYCDMWVACISCRAQRVRDRR